jgi:RNA 2',3'-cyclic 3'-phosphodiesterase
MVVQGGTVRAFICIELPDDVRRSLGALKSELDVGNARFVSDANMHITLLFLGDINQPKLEQVKDVLDRFNHPKFLASIKGIGAFDSGDHGVIFARMDDGAKELAGIHRSLHDGIKRLDIGMDKREYTAHVTIARSSGHSGSEKLTGFVSRNAAREFGSFLCGSIKLKRSQLTPSGPVHTDIYTRCWNKYKQI